MRTLEPGVSSNMILNVRYEYEHLGMYLLVFEAPLWAIHKLRTLQCLPGIVVQCFSNTARTKPKDEETAKRRKGNNIYTPVTISGADRTLLITGIFNSRCWLGNRRNVQFRLLFIGISNCLIYITLLKPLVFIWDFVITKSRTTLN